MAKLNWLKKEVLKSPELDAAVAKLDAALVAGKMGGSTSFAASLCSKYKKYGGATAGQAPYLLKMANELDAPDAGKPEMKVAALGDFSGVFAMFAKAKQFLKFPKVSLKLPSGGKMQLSVAGPGAKKPGTVNVTDGGKFGSNVWYGRVLADGSFEQSSHASAQAGMAEVADMLAMLAKDPVKVASEYGKATGNCCFCRKALSDPKSLAAGYGPVCASNYGLDGAYKAGKGFFEAVYGKSQPDMKAILKEVPVPSAPYEEMAKTFQGKGGHNMATLMSKLAENGEGVQIMPVQPQEAALIKKFVEAEGPKEAVEPVKAPFVKKPVVRKSIDPLF